MDEPAEGYGCANLDEKWRCPECTYTWFGRLKNCPNCGNKAANME
jgi:rubrerythrin